MRLANFFVLFMVFVSACEKSENPTDWYIGEMWVYDLTYAEYTVITEPEEIEGPSLLRVVVADTANMILARSGVCMQGCLQGITTVGDTLKLGDRVQTFQVSMAGDRDTEPSQIFYFQRYR